MSKRRQVALVLATCYGVFSMFIITRLTVRATDWLKMSWSPDHRWQALSELSEQAAFQLKALRPSSLGARRNKRRRKRRDAQQPLLVVDHNADKFPNASGRRLEFVHITKTGGSAIEKAAAHQKGIAWGSCHFNHELAVDMGCPQPPDFQDVTEIRRGVLELQNRRLQRRSDRWSQNWPPHWHLPTMYFTDQHPYNNDNVQTFTIVRNPYDRAVSLYYCPFAGYHNAKDKDNVVRFNAWIQETAIVQPGISMMPQHWYVYGRAQFYNLSRPLVDHVLKYENLTQEFHALMDEYGLQDLRLSEEKYNGGRHHHFSVDDFTPQTLDMLNQKFRRDFEAFGYEMRPGSEMRPLSEVSSQAELEWQQEVIRMNNVKQLWKQQHFNGESNLRRHYAHEKDQGPAPQSRWIHRVEEGGTDQPKRNENTVQRPPMQTRNAQGFRWHPKETANPLALQ